MTHWSDVARARELGIPEDQVERIRPALESLEAAFRPLVAALPFDTEPALIPVLEGAAAPVEEPACGQPASGQPASGQPAPGHPAFGQPA